MKNFIIYSFLFLFGITFAQKPIFTTAKVNAATVYFNAVEITQSATAILPKGSSEIVVKNVADYLNENTVQIQGEGYWFTLNPIFDLQVGKATSNLKDESTYLNTRGIQIQGGLGEELNFTTTIYESQGRFADYVNTYARSIGAKGDPGNAVIPGIGITKSFKSDSFDMPLAEANLTYTPSKAMNLQLGYGKTLSVTVTDL